MPHASKGNPHDMHTRHTSTPAMTEMQTIRLHLMLKAPQVRTGPGVGTYDKARDAGTTRAQQHSMHQHGEGGQAVLCKRCQHEHSNCRTIVTARQASKLRLSALQLGNTRTNTAGAMQWHARKTILVGYVRYAVLWPADGIAEQSRQRV